MSQTIGGQALVEGVMVISPRRVAICVRKPDKKIASRTMQRNSFASSSAKTPFVRGVASLAEMVATGTKALMWSSNQQLKKQEQVGGLGAAVGILVSFALALGLFVALPLFLSKLVISGGFWMNVLDGVFRVALFVAYLLVISRFKDIQRVFEYHGAEHMAIHCYEAGKTLSVRNVARCQKEHPRCGTAFLFLVLIVSIFVFSFITSRIWVLQFLLRLALLPVVTAVSYEILKLASRHQKSLFFRALIQPGIWFQKVTTRVPNAQQILVAIAAVKAAVR